MEAYAILKNVKGSSQKVKLVVDLIRGKMVNEAIYLLRFSNKRAAKPVEAVLMSAVANAKDLAERDNIIVDEDDLWVSEIYVGKGVTKHRRRVRPAPMGRAYRERRHYSHVTVRVSSEKREAKEKKKGKAAKAEAQPAPPEQRG
jgi:large subunit ribosomal protein L22